MNCIDAETEDLLVDAWHAFRDDEDAYVAIITGAGDRAFCSGADLKDYLPKVSGSPTYLRRRAYDGPGFGGFTRGIDIFKPIIAAINGVCFAGRDGGGRRRRYSYLLPPTRASAAWSGGGTWGWATAGRSGCPGSWGWVTRSTISSRERSSTPPKRCGWGSSTRSWRRTDLMARANELALHDLRVSPGGDQGG